MSKMEAVTFACSAFIAGAFVAGCMDQAIGALACGLIGIICALLGIAWILERPKE